MTCTADDDGGRRARPAQESGVVYGPQGIRVRVLPTRQEGPVRARRSPSAGQRRFEGMDLTLEEAQATGAQRLAELAATPTPVPVTPQLEAPTGDQVILAPFATAGLSTGEPTAAPTAKPTKGKKGTGGDSREHARAPGASGHHHRGG